MAMLVFYAGENRFAIDCSSILRIVPNVILNKMPHRAHFVIGLMVLAGEPIPVIDLCQIIEKRPTRPFLNSRIILLKDAFSGTNRCVGLLGEKVDKIIDLKGDQFKKSEFYLHDLHYLEKGYTDNKGIIHSIDLEEFFRFLSNEVFHDAGIDHHEA